MISEELKIKIIYAVIRADSKEEIIGSMQSLLGIGDSKTAEGLTTTSHADNFEGIYEPEHISQVEEDLAKTGFSMGATEPMYTSEIPIPNPYGGSRRLIK